MAAHLTWLQREIREVFLMKMTHELNPKNINKEEPGEVQDIRRWCASHLGFSIYKHIEERATRKVDRI